MGPLLKGKAYYSLILQAGVAATALVNGLEGNRMRFSCVLISGPMPAQSSVCLSCPQKSTLPDEEYYPPLRWRKLPTGYTGRQRSGRGLKLDL